MDKYIACFKSNGVGFWAYAPDGEQVHCNAETARARFEALMVMAKAGVLCFGLPITVAAIVDQSHGSDGAVMLCQYPDDDAPAGCPMLPDDAAILTAALIVTVFATAIAVVGAAHALPWDRRRQGGPEQAE